MQLKLTGKIHMSFLGIYNNSLAALSSSLKLKDVKNLMEKNTFLLLTNSYFEIKQKMIFIFSETVL